MTIFKELEKLLKKRVLRNSAHLVALIRKFYQIWNLETKSSKMRYYTTMFDELDCHGRFKVMVDSDLNGGMTLKPSIFLLAIQELPYIPIATLYLR